MSDWFPQIAGRPGPRYRAIVEALAEGVERGRLKPGDRLPTQRAVAERLGVTLGTVTRAYSFAEAEGLIEGQVGRGTFVRQQATPGVADAQEAGEARTAGFFSMAPACGPFLERFERALSYAAERTRGPEDAMPVIAPLVADFLQQEWQLRVAPERLVFAAGAASATAAAIATLAHSGGPVLAAEYSDPNVVAGLEALGLSAQPVISDAEGLVPESLELACWTSRSKVLYLAPDGSIPTGAVMTAERRRALIRVARQYDLWLIEDRTPAVFNGADKSSLSTLAPDRTIVLVHFGRALYPDLRISALVIPETVARKTRSHLRGFGNEAAPLLSTTFEFWLKEGTAQEAAAWQREQAARRGALARRYLREAAAGPVALTGYLAWLKPTINEAASEEGPPRPGALDWRGQMLPATRFWTGQGRAANRFGIGLGGIEGLTAFERALADFAETSGG